MASKYIQMFPIQEGFPELLNDLAKEVIRNQPEDIIEFCAMYFNCLQQGTVLDYPRKGKNIPCDFKTSIPTIKVPNNEGDQLRAIFEKKDVNPGQYKKSENNNDKRQAQMLREHSKSDLDVKTSPVEMRNLSSKFVNNIMNNSIENYNRNILLNLGESILTNSIENELKNVGH